MLKAALQSAPMDWDRDAYRDVRLDEDVMATADPLQLPSSRFEQGAELLAGEGLHTAISMTRSVSETGTSVISTERQPSTAS